MNKIFRFTFLLIIPIILCSGCLEVVKPTSDTVQIFEITEHLIGDCSLQDKNFTVIIFINKTEIVNSDAMLSFTIREIPLPGATKDDYATIYFSADNFDTQLFKFNGAYQIKWTAEEDFFYITGSKSLSPLKYYNISLQFGFNLPEITKKPISNLTINFRNKENTWSESYDVKFIVMSVT